MQRKLMESRAILHDKVQYLLEQEMDPEEDRAGHILDALFGPVPEDNFHTKLTEIINAYDKDVECNTPDFVLSEYLCMCLDIFKYSIRYRETVLKI